MSVADSYVYDGFNLDLLLGTQAQSQNGTAYLSSINAVAQQKKKAKTQRSRLAERIADTNALLLQMKQLHGAYTDLQNTCNEVTKLFNQEKLERTAYENRCKTLSERCAHQEGIIEEKTFIIEQLHGDEHKLSWTRQELVIITMQLAQCLRENNIKVHGKPMNILKDIAEFCSKAKIQFDKLTAKTPRNCKNVLQNVLNNSQSTQTVGLNESTKVFTSSQATQTGLVETSNQAIQCSAGMPKILNSSRATQTGSMDTQNEGTQRLPKMLTSSQATQTVLIETYNQATQYTSTVVTRSTSTKDLEDNFNAFVKPMRLSIGGQGNKLSKKCEPKNISKTYGVKTTAFVGPQLPEAMPKLDYRQILNEMLISYVPNPLTPIDPLPLLSVGTCTNLCNVHREIDYLCPHMPMIIKRSNSRPASPASNIKDEPFAANTSYEHSNIAKQILNSLPHSDSCLSSVPPNEFTELWRVFGERVLSLLQHRTHPEQKNTPAGFSNWLYELYVITQAEVVPVVAEFDKSPCLPNMMKTANLEKDSENDLETAVNFVSKLNVFRQPANYESELDAEERCLLGFMDTKEKDVYKSNSSNNEQEFTAEICHKGSTSVEFEQVDFNKRDESEKEVPLNGKRNEEKSVRGQLQAADAKKCKKRKRITCKAAKAKKRKIFDYEPNNEFEQRITNNQYSRLNDTTVSPKQIMQTEQTTETRPSVIDFYNAHKKTTRDFGQDSDSDIESAKVNIQYTCKPKIPDLCSSNTKAEFEIQSIEATGSPQTKEQSQQATDIAKNFKLLSLKSLTQPYVIDSYDRYKKITTDLGLNSDSDIDSDEINIPSTSTAEVSELSSTDTKVSGFSPSDVKASVSLKTKKEYQQSTQRIKKLKLSSRKSETQRSVICSYDEYKKITKDLGLNSDSNIEFGEVNIQSTSTAEVFELCSSYTRAETDKYLMQPCVIDSCEDLKKIAADLDLSSDSDIESDEVNMQSTSTAEVSELCSSNNKAETNNFQIQSITATDSPKTKNLCQQTTPFSKKLKLSSTEKQAQLSVIGPCEEYKKIAAELVLSCKSDIESDEVAIQSTCKPKESDLCSTNTKAETAKFEIQSIEATGSPKTKEQSQRAAGIAKNFKLSLKSLTKPCVIEFYDKYKKITTDLGLNSDSDIESDEINIPSTSTAEVSELCSSYTRAETDNYLMQPCVIDSCEEYKKMAADFDLSSDSDIESDEVNMQSISTAEVSELCSYTNKAETDNFQIQSITATNSPKTQNPCQQTTPMSKKLKLSSTEKQAQLSVIGPCEEYRKIANDSAIESDEVTIQSTNKEYVSDLYLSNTKSETDKSQIHSIKNQACDRLNDLEGTDSSDEKISTALESESDSGIESYSVHIQSTNKPVISQTDKFNIQSTKYKACDKLNELNCTDSYNAYEKINAVLDLESDYDIEPNEVHTQTINKPELTCGSKKFDIYNFETNRDSNRMKVNKERHSYDSDYGILDISTNVVFQDLILSDSDNEQKFKNGQPFSNPPSPEPDRLVIDDSDSDAEEELLSTETNSMQNPAASKPSHLEVEPTGEPVIRFGMQNTSEANCDEQQVIHLPCLGYFREAADEIRNCDNVLEPNELSYKTSKVTCPFDDSIVLGDLQETANISINCDNILEPNEPRKETAKEVCSFDYSPASPLAQLTDDQKFITVPEEVALGQRSETKALIVHTIDIVKKERRGRPKILITQADEIKQKMLTKTIAEFLKQSPDVPSTCIDFAVTLDSTTKKEVVIINAFINAFRTLDVKDNEVLRLQPALRHFELKKLDFLQRFIEALDERLFCVKDKPNRKQAHNFVKLYLQLIDVQASNTNSAEYKNPARLFMAKILYHYKVDMPLLINEIVNKYPTVLPHRDERHYDNSDPLITVIKHLLMTHKYNMTDPLGADRCLLNMLRFNYYHFMQYAPTKEQVLENLVEKLKAGKLQDLCFAFALFCKRAITLQVTSSVLGSNLMPLASSYCELSLESDVYDERLEAALTSISMIVKQQPLSTDVSSYMALFKRTLMAAPRPRPEEAAVRAILRLQRFGFNMCESALQNYKPNYELTAMTRSMWASFVRRYRQYRLNANKK